MIWRDDDVGRSASPTALEQLAEVDDVLNAAGLTHTVAVIARDLDQQPALVELIRARRMDVQLHCWTHDDLTVSPFALAALALGVRRLEDLFGRRPTTLYPPWNRSSLEVEHVAADLQLTVSTRKVSLEQFIRAGGDVDCEVINFHYWHEPDRRALAAAVQVELEERRRMKKTDYCPRAAPFDTYLLGRGLVGVEVGVDVGAHAEAMLRYRDIAHLTLVDVWPKEYQYGFCRGRLIPFMSRIDFLAKSSIKAAEAFAPASLDFVYIDQKHDGEIVATDLQIWWPKLKPRGVLGYRNYSGTDTPLKAAVDAFVQKHDAELTAYVEAGEIVLVKR